MRTVILAGIVLAAGLTTACAQGMDTAIFAGGSYWALQDAYERLYGVHRVEAGYTGGTTRNPTSANYAAGGHYQAVRVSYDPTRVSYDNLVQYLWQHTDPTDSGGQFADRGPGYRSAIFWMNDAQRKAAEASKSALAGSRRFDKPIVTPVLQATAFYPAEDTEQDYARKNPERYARYLASSGRDAFFSRVWGPDALRDPAAPPKAKDGVYKKPSAAELRRLLTPLQFEVTQQEGTEPPFNNEFWDNHEAGIYVDIVSGEPLFSSTDKYDSHTGWPSFTRPLEPGNVIEKIDTSYGMVRVEARSRYGDSHLGHLFDDGPPPTGLRYCMDSASLRFVPVADLQKEGYGRYLYLFRK